jgi:ABC-type transport system involved in multi-copper enzyme maturation permease subunit
VNSTQQTKSSLFTRVFSISLNTFRETVRDRILYNLVLFVLLITASAVFLGELTAGNEVRVIVNLGLAVALLFGAFIAIFVGVGLVSKEIEKRTVFAIFSKPVGRGEFLLGKYLGLCLTLLINVVLMAVGISLALLYVGGISIISSVWLAILLIYFELTILTAVALVFSSFSSPTLSALLAFLVFIIGHFSSALNSLAESLGSAGAKFFFNALYYILPNLSFFSYATNAAHGEIPSPAYLATAFLYIIVYITILLTVSIVIFSKRNFK